MTVDRPRGPDAIAVRSISPSDLPALLDLNDEHVPAVGRVDHHRLARLVAWAPHALLAEADGRLAGFVIALGPGLDYDSPNYRWFAERYDAFVYVDRVVVAVPWQRAGLGHRLYDQVEAATDAPVFVCEVNLRPRNEPSLRFHTRRGFEPVGEQDTYGDTRVVLLAKSLV